MCTRPYAYMLWLLACCFCGNPNTWAGVSLIFCLPLRLFSSIRWFCTVSIWGLFALGYCVLGCPVWLWSVSWRPVLRWRGNGGRWGLGGRGDLGYLEWGEGGEAVIGMYYVREEPIILKKIVEICIKTRNLNFLYFYYVYVLISSSQHYKLHHTHTVTFSHLWIIPHTFCLCVFLTKFPSSSAMILGYHHQFLFVFIFLQFQFFLAVLVLYVSLIR